MSTFCIGEIIVYLSTRTYNDIARSRKEQKRSFVVYNNYCLACQSRDALKLRYPLTIGATLKYCYLKMKIFKKKNLLCLWEPIFAKHQFTTKYLLEYNFVDLLLL